MNSKEATNHVSTDPSLTSGEKEMSIGFSKDDDKATIFTAIASQVRRCLTHTDVDVSEIYLYNEDDETHSRSTLEEFEGEDIIVGVRGKVPIESLKVRSNPRSQRSFANIISSQQSVDID